MVQKDKKQGYPASSVPATISESSGIPKEKIIPMRACLGFAPLFTGELFIEAKGVALRRLT
jgi:hypothetical protein